jgi:hypothetical protein
LITKKLTFVTDDAPSYFKGWGVVKITSLPDGDGVVVRAITHTFSTSEKIDLERVIKDAGAVANSRGFEQRSAERRKKAKKKS